jgi:hypothetical protein
MMSFLRFVDKRAIYRWYNLISTCAGECDWLFHRQHKLCATFSANVNINYRLPIKAHYRICTLRHIRIKINHGSQICICYLDVNWLIPKISACQARIWSLMASERSERVTNFIFCRAGWYFSVSIIFTFRWHFYHPKSTINTDTSIFVFSPEKLHDAKYSKYASLKP